jgi:hypothetical protein
MWPLAMAGGAGRPNSGEPLAGAGRARAGVDLGPRGPIPRLGCGGGGTGEGGAGGPARWPSRLEYRRGGLDAGVMGRLGS